MKNERFLTRVAFRLLALVLCLTASIPQMQADTWTVAGTSNAFLQDQNWNKDYSDNNMSQYGNTAYYYLSRTANVNQSNHEFKVVKNYNWDTAYPGSNYGYSVGSNGIWTVVFSINTSNNAVKCVGPFQSIIIAGDDTNALGSSTWDGTNASNTMTTTDGFTYTLTKNATYTGNGTFKFKAVAGSTWNGDSNGNDVSYNIPEAGEYDITYTFDVVTGIASASVVRANVPTYDYTFYVLLPNGRTPYLYLWNGSNKPNGNWPGAQMTQTEYLDDGKNWYKMTVTCEYNTLSAIVDLGNNNYQSANINNLAPGTHYITWDGGNQTQASVSPTAPTPVPIYINGDGILGGFSYQPSHTMTYTGDHIYTYTANLAAKSTIQFVFGNGQGTSWEDYNNNYRIGPTNGSQIYNINSGYTSTQKANGDHGSYKVTVGAGPVTFYFNNVTMQYKVEGTVPPISYYVVGDIFPNAWNIGSGTEMEQNGSIYTWTSGQIHLDRGTEYVYKVKGDDDTWHPSSENMSFSPEISGTYTVTITYDRTDPSNETITAELNLVAADPIYINGDGILGSFTEQPNLAMTYTSNGVYTYTANLAQPATINFVFANGQGNDWNDFNNNYRIGPTNGDETYTINSGYTSTQMAGGDHGHYSVYAGAGTITFYLDAANMQYKVEGTEPPVTYYVVGDDNNIFPNGWNMGDGTNMTYNSTDNNYSWTSGQVQLTAGTNYEYKVHGDDGSWIPGEGQPNASFSVAVSGTYTVTITRNSDGTVTHTLTLINAAPIYIEGSEGLGLQWGYAPTTAMTYDTTTGYYTYTYTVEHDGTYNFMFGNGQGSSWDDFNANYRIGPQSGDQAIALDDQWVSTQMAHTDGGSYQINVAAGPVTIYFDPATMKFKVDASAPTYLYTFYIYPSDGTTVPHIYLWDNAQHPYTNAFPGNEVTFTEVLADGKTWYKYSETILIDVLNAIISGGGNNADNTKTKDITNFEPGTYYIVWDPVRPNGEAYNHFELYNDPPSAVGEHQLFIHGGYYHEGQTYSYASDSGSEMKYYRNPNNPTEEYYYINNITLSSNATFCFSTQLGNGWENVGVRYGNGGPEYTDNPNGTNYLEVTEAKINTMMPLGPWSGTYGEYKMFTAGVYNVLASPSGGWVKLIKTDHKNLSPMNVYLEQTPNVEISNIQEPGTTYTTAMFDGYWPLSAYNQEQGGWNPNSDSQHYPVTYIGDTTTVDGKHWWHWQVNASIAEVFFSRTNKDPKQSEAIVRHAGVLWVTWDEINGQTVMTDHSREYFEAAANALPTNAVVMEGHYYVYFINTLGWDRVFCYAWDVADGQYTDGYNRVMESWPGHICELVGIDPVTGYEVWRYDLGTISSIDHAPDGILFNDGDTNALSDSKEQTGDFEYINGGVYDYLGLFDGAYTLNNLIRTAAEEVRYTVSNDLLAVYYDPNAKTEITYKNKYGESDTETIYGALYAKDLNQYGEKSVKPSSLYTDYVYETCPSSHTAGGSQVMVKKTSYDQSNWVKLVMSPNYDGRNPVPLADNDRPELANYVGHIIPAGTLDVFMTDTINPEAHVLAIQMGKSMTYEPNVYISGHFNDTVVFNYTHRDWQPYEYKGNLRTKPVIEWTFVDGENGKEAVKGTATRVLVQEDPYYMYYVAPKPQEIAYITWVVYDNYNTDGSWPGYTHGTYQPYTQDNPLSRPPVDPGRFYAPMNWDRSIEIPGDAYSQLEYLSDNELDKALGAWSSEYGPYSNAYMQYGGIKVNWSLFDNESNGGPWWQIFKPGQAYKFMAIIRYARGSSEGNNTNNYCYKPSIGYFVDGEDHVYQDDGTKFNAPRRDEENNPIYANMYHTSYRDLDESKFIIFPIKASAQRSNGSGIGNVTEVKEVIADVNVQRDIVAVRYFNLMGIESDRPFDGINIVVTTYSDGTRTSKKILR